MLVLDVALAQLHVERLARRLALGAHAGELLLELDVPRLGHFARRLRRCDAVIRLLALFGVVLSHLELPRHLQLGRSELVAAQTQLILPLRMLGSQPRYAVRLHTHSCSVGAHGRRL